MLKGLRERSNQSRKLSIGNADQHYTDAIAKTRGCLRQGSLPFARCHWLGYDIQKLNLPSAKGFH